MLCENRNLAICSLSFSYCVRKPFDIIILFGQTEIWRHFVFFSSQKLINIKKNIKFWYELQKKRNKTSLFELKYLVGKQLLIKFANEF